MGLLTTHHLMQMLLCSWGQPWALYCPGWTTGDGPCPLSPLVFVITFLFLFFVYLQNSYFDEHTKVKCLLRNIYIKLAIVYNLSVESSFSLYFLQSFSFLLMAYLVIHFPSCFSVFPFRFILMKNKMCPSFRISPATSTFWLSLFSALHTKILTVLALLLLAILPYCPLQVCMCALTWCFPALPSP